MRGNVWILAAIAGLGIWLFTRQKETAQGGGTPPPPKPSPGNINLTVVIDSPTAALGLSSWKVIYGSKSSDWKDTAIPIRFDNVPATGRLEVWAAPGRDTDVPVKISYGTQTFTNGYVFTVPGWSFGI